jgi:hypothetical protein
MAMKRCNAWALPRRCNVVPIPIQFCFVIALTVSEGDDEEKHTRKLYIQLGR